MHMIVVGCGRVGSTVARELTEAGHDVVVIDRRADAFRRLGEDFVGRTMTPAEWLATSAQTEVP